MTVALLNRALPLGPGAQTSPVAKGSSPTVGCEDAVVDRNNELKIARANRWLSRRVRRLIVNADSGVVVKPVGEFSIRKVDLHNGSSFRFWLSFYRSHLQRHDLLIDLKSGPPYPSNSRQSSASLLGNRNRKDCIGFPPEYTITRCFSLRLNPSIFRPVF